MSVRNLDQFFAPRSVVLIGASREPKTVGNVIARNLLQGGFDGPVHFVNPHAAEILGHKTVRLTDLTAAPDLAVIATPAPTVPGIIAEIGGMGTKAAIVIAAGFGEKGPAGVSLQGHMLQAAKPHTLRIVGPNCLGVLMPAHGLNASFAHRMPAAGTTAFVTQSGAMLTAVLDWAASHRIGFSHLVSLGGMSDVDFGDMLDFLANDTSAHAVLLYIESVTNARKFMSAARRCARLKPVIVVKSGRFSEGAKAARSHTGALAGSDAVYDAAFRRAGMLRVTTIEDLFDALETVSHRIRIAGDRLAIVTNGGGAGVLATDCLVEQRGKLARLSPETLKLLAGALPKNWSGENPIDILGDAGEERYRAATEAVLADPNVDALVVINCPVATVDSTAAAQAVVSLAKRAHDAGKPILASWLGDEAARAARQKFDEAGVPQYETPEQAVTAAMRLIRHERAQEMLMETPAAEPHAPRDRAKAQAIVKEALAEKREWLKPTEAHEILHAYGIPTLDVRFARTPDDAARAAKAIGGPVALKIVSRQIVHKSDVGGVALHLATEAAVRGAAEEMLVRVKAARPDAEIDGFLVEQMVKRGNAHELIVGLAEDALFGPVVLFGQGGTEVEVVADRAVALPPLNPILAGDLIDRTRVARLLAGYRDRKPADRQAIVDVLLALQDIAVDLPEVKELDINPLWADEKGVLALDARIKIGEAQRAGTDRFAIKPYPRELARKITTRAGTTYAVRPIRPDDADRLKRLVAESDPEDLRMRFFSNLKQLPDALTKRLTQIDYDREMAFVAEEPDSGRFAGVVRISLDPDHERGEFAVMVRSDLKGTGLGYSLMQAMIGYARSAGAKQLFGDVLPENERMLAMSRALGMHVEHDVTPGIVRVALDL